MGWKEVEIVPFSNDLPIIEESDAFKIIYGSTTFMLNASKDERLKPGVFYDPKTFQMQNYVAYWKEHILNYDGHLMEFGKLHTLNSAPEKLWFIRPNHDGKEFSGKVETFVDLVHWSAQICQLELPDFNTNTEVWIAEPKEILKEWRLFIVDDAIISTSRYMHKGALDESATDIPSEMLDFATLRIAEYRLSDVYVMDIAQVDHMYKLIECNCFNGTGFYKHDIGKIVDSVNDFILRKLA